jgi:hypothetical protein
MLPHDHILGVSNFMTEITSTNQVLSKLIGMLGRYLFKSLAENVSALD